MKKILIMIITLSLLVRGEDIFAEPYTPAVKKEPLITFEMIKNGDFNPSDPFAENNITDQRILINYDKLIEILDKNNDVDSLLLKGFINERKEALRSNIEFQMIQAWKLLALKPEHLPWSGEMLQESWSKSPWKNTKFTDKNGAVIEWDTITSVGEEGLVITSDTGVRKLKFTDLSDDAYNFLNVTAIHKFTIAKLEEESDKIEEEEPVEVVELVVEKLPGKLIFSDDGVKVIEEKFGYVDLSWKVTVKNNTAEKDKFFFKLQLLDAEGFMMDSEIIRTELASGESKKLSGGLNLDSKIWAKCETYQFVED